MTDDVAACVEILMRDVVFSHFLRTAIVVALARVNASPRDWVRAFIADLHERVDKAEATCPDGPGEYHEEARKRVDALGHELLREFG